MLFHYVQRRCSIGAGFRVLKFAFGTMAATFFKTPMILHTFKSVLHPLCTTAEHLLLNFILLQILAVSVLASKDYTV
jgi:hypothetical protein